MTLIGVYARGGSPFLIGDLFITNAAGTQVGVRRKLEILRPNVAVAWTGHEVAAAVAFEDLRQRLPAVPSLSELEASLTATPPYAAGRDLSVRLLFAHLDNSRASTFLWNSAWPDEIYLGDPIYDGSGSIELTRLASELKPYVYLSTNMPQPQAIAMANAMDLAAQLAYDELTMQSHHKLGFGQAYEVLIGDRASFRFHSDILYATAIAQFDRVGKLIGTNPGHRWLRVWSYLDYACAELNDSRTSSREVALARAPDRHGPAPISLSRESPDLLAMWEQPPKELSLLLWMKGPALREPTHYRVSISTNTPSSPIQIAIDHHGTIRRLRLALRTAYLEERYAFAVSRAPRA